MKRIILLTTLYILLTGVANAQEQERIKLFKSEITVDTSGMVTVLETITVHASGDQIQRGIFRTLPRTDRGLWGEFYESEFDVVSVRRNGMNEDYHNTYNTNSLTVYIGNENVMIPPVEHTYEIKYQLKPVVRFFENHDEIYWNVTGNGWAFEIDSVYAIVTLPHTATIQSEGVSAYSGAAGETGCDCVIIKNAQNQVEFGVTAVLRAYEGFTIAVPFDKGVVKTLSEEEARKQFFITNQHLVICAAGFILMLLYYFIAWVAVGRDPKGRLNVPAYTPPDNLPPYTVRYIRKMGFDNKVLIASITFLAQQGYLLVSQESDERYTITKTDKETGSLPDVEQKVLAELFKNGDALEISGEYKPELFNASETLRNDLKKRSREYFRLNSGLVAPGVILGAVTMTLTILHGREQDTFIGIFMTVFASFWGIACAALTFSWLTYMRQKRYGAMIGLIVFSSFFYLAEIGVLAILTAAIGLMPVLVLVLIIVATLAFYYLLRAPTKKGMELMERIDDFAKFIRTAEMPRMQLLTSSMDLDLSLFDQYLPYAIALDLETAWAAHFANVAEVQTTHSDRWYRSGSSFSSPIAISSSFSGFSASISSSSTSRSSSSGSSGGGSSGGGSGGGGGGGW